MQGILSVGASLLLSAILSYLSGTFYLPDFLTSRIGCGAAMLGIILWSAFFCLSIGLYLLSKEGWNFSLVLLICLCPFLGLLGVILTMLKVTTPHKVAAAERGAETVQAEPESRKRNIRSCLILLLVILIVFALIIVLGRLCNEHLERKEKNRFYSLIGKPLDVMLARIKDDYECDILFYKVGPEWKSESIAYLQSKTRISKEVDIEEVIESRASASGIYVLEKDSFTVTLDWYKTVVLVFVDEENIITDIVFVRRA